MIDAILLSGGVSARFWPFTKKTTMSFLGKPLLSWHYEQLVRLGIKRAIVVTNSGNRKDVESVIPPRRLSVSTVVQSGKGQGYAVSAAVSAIGKAPALIINGSDIYDDEACKEIIDTQKKDDSSLLISAVHTKTYFPGGYIKLTEGGMVSEVVEKPKPGKEPSDVMKLVMDMIPDMEAFSESLKVYKRYPDDGYERALNAFIKKGKKAKAVVTDAPWICLKYPWHMLSVMDMCLTTIKGQMIDPSVKIAKYVTIEGPVIFEENVRILEGTKIVGPVFLGRDTIVGNNNIVRMSHIGERCVTGFSTDITRSYIGNDCWFHRNYVGDSVIGDNVSMGSGTVLANLRLDESTISSKIRGETVNTGREKLGAMIGRDARLGVNVSVMPGVKVGRNSFVGAGVVLGEDLEDENYCRVTPTVVISPNTKKSGEKSREQFKKHL